MHVSTFQPCQREILFCGDTTHKSGMNSSLLQFRSLSVAATTAIYLFASLVTSQAILSHLAFVIFPCTIHLLPSVMPDCSPSIRVTLWLPFAIDGGFVSA